MAKRRKKRKRTGLLKQMARPALPDEKRFTFSEIFEGKTEMTDEGVEMVKGVWETVTTTSPFDLVTEARGYGYPLKSLVEFYIKTHEKWKGQADDDDDFEELQGNIDYLKDVETWDDFEPIMEGLEGEPPEGIYPCVPVDLVTLIVDRRITEISNAKTIEDANSSPAKEVVGFLGLEALRKHRGLPIETSTNALEMPVDSYKIFIDALKERAENDENISRQVKLNQNRIDRGYL